MSANLDDAKAKLQAAIAAAKTFLADQDDPGALSITFNKLAQIRDAISEWIRAAAILAHFDNLDEPGPTPQVITDMRVDAQRLVQQLSEARRIVMAFAARARVP